MIKDLLIQQQYCFADKFDIVKETVMFVCHRQIVHAHASKPKSTNE